MHHLASLHSIAAILLGLAQPASSQTEDPDWSRMALDEAALACSNNNPGSFFTAFLGSSAVRQKYTADELAVITNGAHGRVESRVPGRDYADFPLAIIDYYYVTTIGPARDGYAHIKHEINQSADNRLRVDWVSVFYDGNSEGGDDPGAEIGTGDDPGTLLFYPTDTCWELVQVEITLSPGQ
jgi:hypothetical protein